MKRFLALLLILAAFALGGCTLDSLFSGLVNQPPQAVIDASPAQGQAPLTVHFNAASSHDDHAIRQYHWDFGDPKSTAPLSTVDATHTYLSPGTYVVKLTVVDEAGEMSSDKIAVVVENPPPVAAFTMDNELPPVGVPVVFDASASYDPNGEVKSYTWDFGDGSTGNGAKTNHSYSKAVYTVVTLTVTDNEGAVAIKRQAVVPQAGVGPGTGGTGGCGGGGSSGGCSGTGDKPLAVISGLPSCAGIDAGTTLTLDGSYSRAAQGTLVRYDWDFGDGETAIGAIVQHTYEHGGRFKVTLTVHDNSGNQTSAWGFLDVH